MKTPLSFLPAAILAAGLVLGGPALAAGGGHWLTGGQDANNARHAKTESRISAENVSELAPAWVAATGGDVSATPAVDGSRVYFPDWAGNLFAVDRDSGEVAWQRSLEDYTGIPGLFARTTPAVAGHLLIFGDQGGRSFAGARVMAVDKNSGELVWSTLVDEHPAAIITASAAVAGDLVLVGVASMEERFAAEVPGYECCSFRGSLTALNKNTGEIVWKTYTTAEGFSGNAVWGSTPSIDRRRGQVYIATGNNYSAPDDFLDCVSAAGGDTEAQRACLAPYPGNAFDSVMALDLKTGAVRWSNAVIPFDVWTVECLFGLPSCPDPEGPGFDFGQAPVLFRAEIDGKKRDLLGVGQKSGIFWCLDPDDGEVVWSRRVDTGGVAGGMIWGSAWDGERLYTSSANSEYQPWLLPDGGLTTAGVWTALDPSTGTILWQRANPTGANAGGAPTVANGVVFVGSQDPDGHVFGLDAATGEILWDFSTGGSCNAGAAVVNGSVYWGSGYGGFGPPNTSNDKLFAFELP